MTTHPFDDPAARPDEAALTLALGKAMPHWDALLAYLDEECSGIRREWKFYGAKYGWQLKAVRRKSALLYLVPRRGGFLAALALGASAVEAVRASGLPPALVREIEGARTYAEGKPARIEVTSKKHLELVKRLVAIKLST